MQGKRPPLRRPSAAPRSRQALDADPCLRTVCALRPQVQRLERQAGVTQQHVAECEQATAEAGGRVAAAEHRATEAEADAQAGAREAAALRDKLAGVREELLAARALGGGSPRGQCAAGWCRGALPSQKD